MFEETNGTNKLTCWAKDPKDFKVTPVRSLKQRQCTVSKRVRTKLLGTFWTAKCISSNNVMTCWLHLLGWFYTSNIFDLSLNQLAEYPIRKYMTWSCSGNGFKFVATWGWSRRGSSTRRTFSHFRHSFACQGCKIGFSWMPKDLFVWFHRQLIVLSYPIGDASGQGKYHNCNKFF